MSNDLFGNLGGGLGGLVKGLSNFMPQDDPAVKALNAQTEVSDLKKQEQELYAQIGRQAVAQYGLESFGDIANKLQLVQANLQTAQANLDGVKAEQAATEEQKRAEDEQRRAEEAARTCPNCGTVNPEGVNFCQECGTKVGAAGKQHCTSCGAELPPGTRFCGACGARQEV